VEGLKIKNREHEFSRGGAFQQENSVKAFTDVVYDVSTCEHTEGVVRQINDDLDRRVQELIDAKGARDNF